MTVQDGRGGLIADVDERTSLLGQHPHLQRSNDSYKTLIPQTSVEAVEDIPREGSHTEKPFPKDVIRSVFPILLMGSLGPLPRKACLS